MIGKMSKCRLRHDRNAMTIFLLMIRGWAEENISLQSSNMTNIPLVTYRLAFWPHDSDPWSTKLALEMEIDMTLHLQHNAAIILQCKAHHVLNY